MSKKTVLICNLGSPKSTDVGDVRSYLQEFLMDPYVIDIPKLPRALLVYTVISFVRARKSAEAYKEIWDEKRGSPLMYHSQDFVQGLRDALGDEFAVELGMRYAEPSIREALEKLVPLNRDEITIAIMYPQYALSSTETAYQKCEEVLDEMGFRGKRRYIKDFYNSPAYLNALKSRATEMLPKELGPKDRLLMSFHGIPEKHLSKLDSYMPNYCLTEGRHCCDELTDKNRNCYRAQCYETARNLAKAMGLSQDQYFVSFQSRLAGSPWITPYTDKVLEEWAKEGVENVYVTCPAFVADCLETLEEIEMGEAERFIEAGGKSLTLVPAPNAHPQWIQEFSDLLKAKES